MGKLTNEELDLQTTIMGIRELLMSYFKGTCIDRLSGADNVHREPIYRDREPYQYQRQERERRNECQVMIHNVPIIKVQQLPDTITMLNAQLGKSKQFRAVRESILDFMDKYLQGVVVKEEGTLTNGRRDDRVLMEQPRNRHTPQDELWGNAGQIVGVDIIGSPSQRVSLNSQTGHWYVENILEDMPF